MNEPERIGRVLDALDRIRQEFTSARGSSVRISLADLIVLAGGAAVAQGARDAGYDVTVPFRPGRTDASPEQTDVESFGVLEPVGDGFRCFVAPDDKLPPEQRLLDRANMLTLTAPEMTVLVGGLRSLGATHGGVHHGVLTDRPGTLTNDVFVHLLGTDVEWRVGATAHVYEGRDRRTGEVRWTATAADLVFASHSQLRALAEYYAAADAGQTFVHDFVAAWTKVMELDRFDLQR